MSWLRRGGRLRLAVACAATALVLGPLVWFWQASLLPDTYSVTDMGFLDAGGHTGAGHIAAGQTAGDHTHHGAGRTLASLVADPSRPADVAITLTARHGRFRLASGRIIDGYTLNGQSPGPTIRATAGQLVQ